MVEAKSFKWLQERGIIDLYLKGDRIYQDIYNKYQELILFYFNVEFSLIYVIILSFIGGNKIEVLNFLA